MSVVNVKQVIVMRTDLQMRKGKMIAQGAHASLKVFLDRANFSISGEEPRLVGGFKLGGYRYCEMNIRLYEEMELWIRGKFTKICVRVDSEVELLRVYNKSLALNLPSALIKDAGLTEFKEPTLTCCAIGPASSEEIDKVTGDLKLL